MVVAEGGRILGASIDLSSDALPALPAEEALMQARSGRPYVSLDPGVSGPPDGGPPAVPRPTRTTAAGGAAPRGARWPPRVYL